MSAGTAFTTIRTEGAILPPDILNRIAAGDKDLGGLTEAAYHLTGEKFGEATNRAWNRLQSAWLNFQTARESLAAGDAGTTIARERWLLPLFQLLDYGRLQIAKAQEVGDKTYAISHSWQHVPFHLVGCNVDLDSRHRGTSPHSLLQEFLNRSEGHLWGIVSNGLRLRLLRDNISLTRQAYVEFDLEAMMAGEAYPDFVLLWLLLHQSRFEGERPELAWIEKWSQAARTEGVRVLEGLRDGVQRAIESLGQGALAHPANTALREALRSGALDKQDYYRELLRLVYRFIFLFVAEDRDLLLDPSASAEARERYTKHYAVARIRRLAISKTGSRHDDLYRALKFVMIKLSSNGCPELALPALGSFLFSPNSMPHLDTCEISNRDLLAAVRSLAVTQTKQGRRGVDYKNLGAEELGSVYESLLELHPAVDTTAALFELRVAAGSERKTSGSYYTPTSLISCLLDSALNPVLNEASNQPKPEEAILKLKVVDPACGSGHFLIAAAHRIAKRLAAVRTGEEEPPPEAQRKALRDVIGHCIYGVDVNPMAVELCKVSLWMEALEPGKPLSFLEHRIQCGNSLLGATPALLSKGIPDEAFTPIEGDDKEICKAFKRINKDERNRQMRLFAATTEPWHQLGNFASSLMNLDTVGDDSIEAVREKERMYEEAVRSGDYLDGRFWADTWCAAFVWKKTREFSYPITEEVFRRIERNPHACEPWMRHEIERLAAAHRFFHWHLAFPDVFKMPRSGDSSEKQGTGWTQGFDVVVGNPPFVNAIEGDTRERLKAFTRLLHPTLSGTADSSYLFLDKSASLIRPGGRVGLIQPRPMLNSSAAASLRSDLLLSHPPSLLYVPGRSDFFPGVTVFACVLVLGGGGCCRVSIDPDPTTANWFEGVISGPNWWLAVNRICGRAGSTDDKEGPSLGEYYQVAASLTTGEAYDLRAFIQDSRDGEGPKMVTTGLIDPGICHWGERTCKYLKRNYAFPRVVDEGMSAALLRRVSQSKRPKVLVAGLSRKVESFLDAKGEFMGVVSTFSIFHPRDEIGELEMVQRFLQSESVDRAFRVELGANAVGGGDTVMRKDFLQGLRIKDH